MGRYLGGLIAGFSTLWLNAAPGPGQVNFDRDIRPILSDTCFQCHGPDEKRRFAGLRLDVKEGMFSKSKRGELVAPGSADHSLLYQRISHADPARRMPPPTSGRTLTPPQIDLIRRWIDQGAKWEMHWAFAPLSHPDVPTPAGGSWAKNPIDRFIAARLEKEGLKPSPEADRITLLRRLSFDLTGLPPTPEEIAAFTADKSDGAYEKQVDRLLASPRYGERMAMQWLDLARYADSHGYHIDSRRDMWPWRDWVIRAYQQNMPFDRFTILQLAGDLLPSASQEDKIATGFNRNHMINFEGGAIPEEYQVEYVVDRVEATSAAWMGLTMGCARCHSHKYDPISHKEFYQFYAFFNNVDEKGLDGREGNAKPFLKLPTPEQSSQEQRLKERIQQLETALESQESQQNERAWRESLEGKAASFPREGLEAHYAFDGSLVDVSGRYQDGRTLKGDPGFGPGQIAKAVEFDGQTLVTLGAAGAFPAGQPFTVAFWLKHNGGKQPMPVLEKIDRENARRGWEIWLDDPVLAGIQKRAMKVRARLSADYPAHAIEVRTKQRITQGEWNHVTLAFAGGGAAGLTIYLNGEAQQLEVLSDTLKDPLETRANLLIGEKEPGAKAFSGGIDDLRFYSRALPVSEIRETAVHYPARAVLSGVGGKLTKREEERLHDYYLRYAAPAPAPAQYQTLRDLREESKLLEKQILTTMIMQELPKPRETFILARGDYRNHGEKVSPGTPSVLPPLPPADGAPNRLTLAKWLVSPSNPLTARVAVNRYWQMYFGTGLVKTAENFGAQGDPPSNPELLDWLAGEFMRSGWDVKGMQKLIVTSAAYRQTSRTTPELLEKDPENRLLARGPRFRLPAEMIRDNALAVSGLLNDHAGGPSVFPYQPKGLWEELAFGDGFSMQTYPESHGPDLYRRSLYTFWKRSVPPAQLSTFDAPDREKCVARRSVTNTPLQALVLLNDPTYVEAARRLAEMALHQAPKDQGARAALMFRRVTGREPGRRELQILRQIARKQEVHYRGAPSEAAKLVRVGESAADAKLAPTELAAWTMVASAVLNLDETITKE